MWWLRIHPRFLAALLALTLAAPVRAEGSWTVSAGDTLSAIAARTGVGVDELRTWNGLSSDRLVVDQALRLTPPADAPPTGPTYQVKAGDTLSAIAESLDMHLADLVHLNPGLHPDRIREGQVLRVGSAQRRVRHRVAAGENLSVIAARFRTRVSEIVRANPGLSPDRVRAGQLITVYTNVPASESESVGTPNDGRLKNAMALPSHPGYVIRDHDRAFGTAELVYSMRSVFDEFLRSHPRAPKVEVHDLSLRAGGPIADHRSHQSGRDVDLAYMYKGCHKRGCRFKRVSPKDLDAELQWALLKPWLQTAQVEAVFMDYALQREVYKEAKRDGASRDELALWFQYPRGKNFPLGVVRHYPAHADHMHVRIGCHKTDGECKTFRPLLMQAQHAMK